MDNKKIQSILPHRHPFLLVDQVIEIDDNEIFAKKNITANEPCFLGHFPDQPIYPGVLIVEGLAQCGGLLALQNVDKTQERILLFTGIQNARFRRPAIPGNTLLYKVKKTKNRKEFHQFEGIVFLDALDTSPACIASFSATTILKSSWHTRK